MRSRTNTKLGASRAVILFLLVACSSSVPIASPVSTSNACTSSADCAAYHQDGNPTCLDGACIAFADRKDLARFRSAPYAASSPLTLVVSVPDTESFGFGSSVVVTGSEIGFAGPGSDPCVGDLASNTCVGISGTFLESGAYETDPLTAQQLGRTLNPGLGFHTSLPSHTTFRLLTSDTTSLTTRAATGLPVLPIYGTVGNHFSSALSVSPIGPGLTAPITWLVNLQPGRYQREVTVDPPFNDAFPPWRDVLTIQDDQPSPDELLLTAPSSGGTPVDPKANRTYIVSSAAVDLTGWSTFLRDTASGRTVSSTTIFSPSLASAAAHGHVVTSGGDVPGVAIVLNTVTPVLASIPMPTDQTGTELVISPPDGVVYPTLVYPALAGKIAQDQAYPSPPSPAVVQGVVNYVSSANATTTPVSAWVDFVSVQGAGVLSQGGNSNVDLRYRTSVHTATNGSYSVRLPRGPYNVVVTPDPTTPYAVLFQTSKNAKALIVADDTIGTSDGALQSGKGFSLSLLTPLAGHVTLTDGRPLGGIEVEARPSFANYDRTYVPTELDAIMPAERGASTFTDGDGFYSLSVDPGIYDIFAKAPASSGFAWGVTTAHAVAEQPVVVDLQVPVPLDASMRIYQTTTSTLAGALVRAYVAAGPAGPASPAAQIQIGEGVTDSNGLLTLFLSPELPK